MLNLLNQAVLAIRLEPVIFANLIQTIITVGLNVGVFHLTLQQASGIIFLTSGVISIIARQQVTPTVTLSSQQVMKGSQ